MVSDTRERILSALRRLLASGGTAAATLENVAAEAGVSKGGLLYHFPSKRELYLGLLTLTRDEVSAQLGSLTSRDQVVRAFLNYSAPQDEEERGFVTAMINAVRGGTGPAPDPDDDEGLDGLLAQIFAAWEEPVRSVVDDPVTAELILQVGNGLYLSAICGLPAPDPRVLSTLVDRLVADAAQAGSDG